MVILAAIAPRGFMTTKGLLILSLQLFRSIYGELNATIVTGCLSMGSKLIYDPCSKSFLNSDKRPDLHLCLCRGEHVSLTGTIDLKLPTSAFSILYRPSSHPLSRVILYPLGASSPDFSHSSGLSIHLSIDHGIIMEAYEMRADGKGFTQTARAADRPYPDDDVRVDEDMVSGIQRVVKRRPFAGGSLVPEVSQYFHEVHPIVLR